MKCKTHSQLGVAQDLLGKQVRYIHPRGLEFTCFVAQIDDTKGITIKYLDRDLALRNGVGKANDGSCFCINFNVGALDYDGDRGITNFQYYGFMKRWLLEDRVRDIVELRNELYGKILSQEYDRQASFANMVTCAFR